MSDPAMSPQGDPIQNLLASMTANAALKNADLANGYLQYFNQTFLVELNNQNIPANSQPKTPPASWVVGLDDHGVPIETQTGPAVCAIPSFKVPVFQGAVGFSTAAPATTDTQNAMMQAMLGMLVAIKAKTDKLP